MVSTAIWIVIVPPAIVDRNPHFRWISMVETIRTPVVFMSPVVLGVVDVRIMVESVPVLSCVG